MQGTRGPGLRKLRNDCLELVCEGAEIAGHAQIEGVRYRSRSSGFVTLADSAAMPLHVPEVTRRVPSPHQRVVLLQRSFAVVAAIHNVKARNHHGTEMAVSSTKGAVVNPEAPDLHTAGRNLAVLGVLVGTYDPEELMTAVPGQRIQCLPGTRDRYVPGCCARLGVCGDALRRPMLTDWHLLTCHEVIFAPCADNKCQNSLCQDIRFPTS